MDISQKFDLGDYPEPQKSTVLAALTEIVLIKLAAQLYEDLSIEDKETVDAMDEEPTAEQSAAMWRFFGSRYPNIGQRVQVLIDQQQASLNQRLSEAIELIKKPETVS